MRNSLLSLLIIITVGSCVQPKEHNSRVVTLPYYDEPTFTPHWLTPGDAALDTFHRIPAFSLTNQDGQQITEATFEDKIYVVDFFFTFCPGICPKMTAQMMTLQEEFVNDDDVLLMSHSVTPTRDSVPVLKRYAEDKGIRSGKWQLVTGSQEDIYRLGRRAYFVEEDLGREKDLEEFLHTENFVLLDSDRHIRGIYNGLSKTSVSQLIADIYTLKGE